MMLFMKRIHIYSILLVVALVCPFPVSRPAAAEEPVAYVKAFKNAAGLDEFAKAHGLTLHTWDLTAGEWAILIKPASYPAQVSFYDDSGFEINDDGTFKADPEGGIETLDMAADEAYVICPAYISEGLPNILIGLKNAQGFFTWAPAFSGEDGSLITTEAFAVMPGPNTGQTMPETLIDALGMEFILIPAGEFMMGADRNDDYIIGDDTPPHPVKIDRPFYMAKYEVSQAQWLAVMGHNPSVFVDPSRPVDSVTMNEALEFIRLLNEKAGYERYRLPSEAEWEYAARAGSAMPLFFGNDIKQLPEYAWFDNNSNGTSRPTGQKKPNPFGLYDIYGNVWELVADNHKYPAGPQGELPDGPFAETYPVARGGSWSSIAQMCHSVFRYEITPDTMNFNNIGLRLVLLPK